LADAQYFGTQATSVPLNFRSWN